MLDRTIGNLIILNSLIKYVVSMGTLRFNINNVWKTEASSDKFLKHNIMVLCITYIVWH